MTKDKYGKKDGKRKGFKQGGQSPPNKLRGLHREEQG